MTRRMPSTYIWGSGRESVVITPANLAYVAMRREEFQALLSAARDTEFGDWLLAMSQAALNFQRDARVPGPGTGAPLGVEQVTDSTQESGLTAAEAAVVLGHKGSRGVRQAIDRGRLPATKDSQGRWCIQPADLEIYRTETDNERD